MAAQRSLARAFAVSSVLLGSRVAAAACTITELAPTGAIQTQTLGPRFSFVATHDCVTLDFLAEGGTVSKAPRERGATPGADVHYEVTLSSDEWAVLTYATNETLTWSIVGTTAGGARTRVSTTNELDLDGDGVARTNDCDDGDASALSCSVALDDPDLHIDFYTPSGGRLSVWDMQTPDLTGDGTADLLWSNYVEYHEGAVFLMDGAAPSPDVGAAITIRAGDRDEWFGAAYDAGDSDGDGTADLVVSAPVNTAPAIYVFAGPITGNTYSGAATTSLVSDRSNGNSDVDILSDHDGDGSADLAVGMLGAGDFVQGAVVVVSDPMAQTGSLLNASTYVYRGKRTFGSLGERTVELGDNDGDGLSDLVMGAFSTRRTFGVSAYVVEGGRAPGTYLVDDVASATLTESKERASFLGLSMVGTDYDGDGLSDLLVSAPWRDVEFGDYAGSVFAFLGPISGALTPEDAPIRWDGRDDQSTNLGRSVSSGDADGDGQPDVVMTGGGTHPAFLQLGLATGVVSSSQLVPFETGRIGDLWVDGSAFIPDWTGDGSDEIAIGIVGQQNPSAELGGEYILYSDGLF